MSDERVERRLAAILAADVVGFSRMMEQDEAGTLATLKDRRKAILEPLVANHRGRLFKVMGDGVLVEFASAVNAVQCALDLQRDMAAANGDLAENRHIVLRVGVNLGDIVVEGGDLYGDGVNIAARLEGLAEPGGVLISASAYEQVKNKIGTEFQSLGPQSLKNIAERVCVFRATGMPRARVPSPKVVDERPSIAVLPFINASGDPDQDYFSDGVTEDIIAGLSRFHELLVIARASSFAYKGQSRPVSDIAAELGAKYIVEGRIRKLGGKLRLAVQLLQVSDAHQLWAERYDQDLKDIFAVQDAITRAIVAAVMGRVIDTSYKRSLQATPEQLLAYDCWLRGQHQSYLWTAEGDAEALMWYERALAKDPCCARAHSSIALLLNVRVLTAPGYPDEAADRSRALRHAQLSVEYDNADARSHLSLAFVSMLLRDLVRARRHLLLAEELNPNAADTLMSCAVATAYLGDAEKGKELAEQARALNPLYADWYPYMLSQILFLAGDFEGAFEVGHPYIAAFPELSAWTAAALGILGRATEARAEGQRFLEIVASCWAGPAPMRPEDAVNWFLSINCFLCEADTELLVRGLKAAGLPLPDAQVEAIHQGSPKQPSL
jgi:TolB-like protein